MGYNDAYKLNEFFFHMNSFLYLKIVGSALFQPVEWHIKPLDDGCDENKMLLKSKNTSADPETHSESDEETELYHTTEIGYKDNEELIALPKTTIRSRISKAMDLQLLKDPVFCSIAVGLALAYTASTNFSMLFPYFLQV